MNVNEFDLIERLTAGLPTNPSLVTGPGDDCAVLDLGVPDRLVLFKTDAVVEGVHFTAETPPEKIGHKALARCLSDIAAIVTGSIGLAASANLDPGKRNPSLFEPVHGSAPDIAGRGIANPLATILAAAMMLEHLGLDEAASAVDGSVRAALASGAALTPDLGGSATTASATAAVIANLG